MNWNDWITAADDFVWGWVLIILIIGAGILLTVRTRFVQIFHLGRALKFMVKNEQGGKGEVSSFGALCTALSATIGTGNIVGVATAIVAGGPGALFWMILAAFFGMATKYSEGLLAIKYRTVDENGHVLGGPFYYIERGIHEVLGGNWKWLGKLFAFFGTLAGIMGIGTITQINGITEAADRIFKEKPLFTLGDKAITVPIIICGAVVTVLAALVILGGIKRIARVSEIVIPFITFFYLLLSFIIFFYNIKAVPSAVVLIVKSAFDISAVGGAIVGLSLKTVIQKGVGRGIFSNEAGLGSAPIAAAAAQTNSCVRQGLVTMTGTFIDTIVICTMTGLSIVITGAWNPEITGEALQGFHVSAYAWEHGLPFADNFCMIYLSVCLSFFAFTTILGWNYYSERCLEYLLGAPKKTPLFLFRILYILAVAVGPYLTVSAVWNLADIANGLMAFPNLVALILLSGVVSKETKAYFQAERHRLR
ncbi:MAG: alanine:cation symporter family protein [Clostridia bacterium]|nr:alanine:cation symporter family protein [Clostridia bacterium]